jgi:hypothetical protein
VINECLLKPPIPFFARQFILILMPTEEGGKAPTGDRLLVFAHRMMVTGGAAFSDRPYGSFGKGTKLLKVNRLL